MTNQQQDTLFLTASDVAAWQLPELADKKLRPCHAALPALQRGAVWQPRQTVESGGNQIWEALHAMLQHRLPFWEHAVELPCLHGEWKSCVQDLLKHPSQQITPHAVEH